MPETKNTVNTETAASNEGVDSVPFPRATRLSSILGGEKTEKVGRTFTTDEMRDTIRESPTLGKISEDVSKIKKLLVDKFKTSSDKLAEKEKEIEEQVS